MVLAGTFALRLPKFRNMRALAVPLRDPGSRQGERVPGSAGAAPNGAAAALPDLTPHARRIQVQLEARHFADG